MKKTFSIIIPIIVIALAIAAKFLISNFRFFDSSGEASAAPTKTGLVGYWTMDDESVGVNNDTINDSSGFKNHGAMINSVTSAAGKVREARKFNGSQYINISNSGSLNFGTADSFTITGWFKVTGGSGTIRRIVSNGHYGWTNGYLAVIGGGLQMCAGIGAGGSQANSTFFCTAAVSQNIWHHFAAVFDRSTNRQRIYLDNVSSAVSQTGGTCGTFTGNDLNVSACTSLNATSGEAKSIGRSNTGSTEYFIGSIDDIRIYSRALSAAEVDQLYKSYRTSRSGAATKTSSYAGGLVVGYWPMDDADVSGSTLSDRSGYGNNGTLTGTASVSGYINQARSFNGTTDMISLPNTVSFSGPVTISAWVYPTKFDSYDPVFASGLWVMERKSPELRMAFWIYDNGTWRNSYTTGDIPLNNWTHYAGVYNGTNIMVYANGVQSGTPTASGQGGTTQSNVRIGRNMSGTEAGRWWDGYIDEVRIFNYALSSQEINDLYNSVSLPAHSGQLIGHWSMDSNNINGTTYYDRSGLNRHATSTGNPTIAAGKIKQGADFNGSSQFIGISRSSEIDFTNETFSMSLWVNPDAIGDNMYLYAKAAQTTGYGLYVNTAGKLVHSTSGGNGITSTSTLRVGQWTHIAIAADGTYGTIYVDGVLDNRQLVGTITDTSTDLRIGANSIPLSLYFNGKIDDVRIYNYAMSAQEAANLYSSAKINYAGGGNKTGLVGYWTMDNTDRSGNLMYDKSGFNNNGTLTGTTTSTGRIGQARNFNGTSDVIKVKSSAIIGNRNNSTVTAWIKTSAIGANYRSIYSEDISSPVVGTVYLLRVNHTTGVGEFYIRSGNPLTGGDEFATGAKRVDDNRWHFMVATLGSDAMKLYVDGTQDGSDTNTTPSSGTINSIWVGKITNVGIESYFLGSIDDVRVYDRTLSAQEIVNLYNSARVNYK